MKRCRRQLRKTSRETPSFVSTGCFSRDPLSHIITHIDYIRFIFSPKASWSEGLNMSPTWIANPSTAAEGGWYIDNLGTWVELLGSLQN